MKTRIMTFTLMLLTAWAVVPNSLVGQQDRRPPRQQMERQLRERFQQMMRERLELTDDQAAAMRALNEELGELRRDLAVREARLKGEVRARGGTLDEERARELLDEILAIQAREAELVQIEIERMRDVLQARQIIAFILLREEMGERIREIRSRRGRGGGAGDVPAERPRLPGPGTETRLPGG